MSKTKFPIYPENTMTDGSLDLMYTLLGRNDFVDKDSELIYRMLTRESQAHPFGEYLKRYIHKAAGIQAPFDAVAPETYQAIIRDSFRDNGVPPAFEPTTAKLVALAKNWLTQVSVSRRVVFLLGFGLSMSEGDVNMLLTKGLREPGISAKDPFEVMCRYCYVKGFRYAKFRELAERYEALPTDDSNIIRLSGEKTADFSARMHKADSDAALMAYLAFLKSPQDTPRVSVTAYEKLTEIYDGIRDRIAALYNAEEELPGGKANPGAGGKRYVRDDITPADVENLLCASVPKDKHGNLVPMSRSTLNSLFYGKRLSRQRLCRLLSRETEINRFDLITLHFFLCALGAEEQPNEKARFTRFWAETDSLLNACDMEGIMVQNPYEAFILLCIISVEPLTTFSDVWEMSFGKQPQ